MNKPKFNIDAHAYWLLCEGQQVEVGGQKIQLTIVDEEKKTIDLHTDSWAVYNDGSQRFKDTVVKWLNENIKSVITGSAQNHYYGIDKNNRPDYGLNQNRFTHILTIDEFCALAYPEKEEVTDTPPLPSLKYEDCFERIRPQYWVDDYANIFECKDSTDLNNVPTERQAKQLAATIKLMTVMYDANGGEWIPKSGEQMWSHYIDRAKNVIAITDYKYTASNPIYFRDEETAHRAYEENKQVFNDYFGIGGENE